MLTTTDGLDIPSMPKVWALGSAPLFTTEEHRSFLDGDVMVQEKVDGSQISFGLVKGQLRVRSKNQDITRQTDGSMFAPAVRHLHDVASWLIPNAIYRGECLAKRKHNVLTYDRMPDGHVALFEVTPNVPMELTATERDVLIRQEAEALGLSATPLLHHGPVTNELRDELMGLESFLGGCRLEGIVLKRYDMRTRLGQPVFQKIVAAEFKEQHKQTWGGGPSRGDFLQAMGEEFRTPARFRKSVQRMKEAGLWTGTASDIGWLMKDLSIDFEAEHAEQLGQRMWTEFRKQVMASANRGFADWYKGELANVDKVTEVPCS